MPDISAIDEKTIINTLIQSFGSDTETPTRESIEERARKFADILGYLGVLDNVVDAALRAVDSRMGEGVSLISQSTTHDEKWLEKRIDQKNINWTYSKAYGGFLNNDGWNPRVVNTLNDVCSKILINLQDPLSEGAWKRRGLVIGHVQSGKTANYMGLIAQAADVGYKFIIVIAGIHNNLRRQTQERFDEGFIGISSDPRNRRKIGVGETRDYPHPATLTTIYDDFNQTTANQSGWRINDFTKPIILVIKKNVKTLDELYKWLFALNGRGGRISDVPMLLIDDEADNASINTNKDDIKPTRTNAAIRKILSLFEKSSFIGYTATPFANIFINPDAYDDDVEEELFPSDFIYCLDAPTSYFGPSKVFSNDPNIKNEYLKEINDCESHIPAAHRNLFIINDLPPSLYRAINQFILVKAIRIVRGQGNKHCSMMVNVSRFVSVQKQVHDHASEYLGKAKASIQANYMRDDSISQKNIHMREIKKIFDDEYKNCQDDWAQIKAKLLEAINAIKPFVINSKTEDVLDYKKYEKIGGLTALAIGGLSLSRGLTIEGLCISYMYRNTKMYDTLMQMGRWFGYRYGYEELCRIYLSKDSINWYRHISEVSEELRDQVYSMRRANKTPREFGLYVRSHDDALMITAANKMRTGEVIRTNVSFSGKVKESYILSSDVEVNKRNENKVKDLFDSCQSMDMQENDKGWHVNSVDSKVIIDFIRKFEIHVDYRTIHQAVLDYFEKISSKYVNNCDILFVSKNEGFKNSITPIGAQDRKSAEPIDGGFRLSSRRVATAGDEKYGLPIDLVEKAEQLFKSDSKNSGIKSIPDRIYREVRNRPLLMVHILSPIANDTDMRVPAYGLSFPMGDEEKIVEIVVNPAVWFAPAETMQDDPDFEDDYDV